MLQRCQKKRDEWGYDILNGFLAKWSGRLTLQQHRLPSAYYVVYEVSWLNFDNAHLYTLQSLWTSVCLSAAVLRRTFETRYHKYCYNISENSIVNNGLRKGSMWLRAKKKVCNEMIIRLTRSMKLSFSWVTNTIQALNFFFGHLSKVLTQNFIEIDLADL